mgnify:CR=1 FL=1
MVTPILKKSKKYWNFRYTFSVLSFSCFFNFLVFKLLTTSSYYGCWNFKKDGMKVTKKWGVIPYRQNSQGKVEFLIVSTAGGKWVFPKGNLIKRLGPTRTAQLEAYEEAGIAGDISPSPYTIKVGTTKFFFYPLQVSKVFKDWPESNVRARKWVRPKEAANYLRRRPFKQMLRTATMELV